MCFAKIGYTLAEMAVFTSLLEPLGLKSSSALLPSTTNLMQKPQDFRLRHFLRYRGLDNPNSILRE